MKVIITESQYNRAIDRFITYLLEPHEEITNKLYLESIQWYKDDVVIAEVQPTLEYFYLVDELWYRISDMFGLDHDETESMINLWLGKNYGLGNLTPKIFDT